MNEFLKFVKALLAKGFATADEKAKAKTLFARLTKDEQETVEPEAEQAETLPEEPTKPEGDEPNGEGEGTPDEELQKAVKELVAASLRPAVSALKAELQDEVKTFLKEQKELMSKKAGVFHEEVSASRGELNKRLHKTMQALLVEDVTTLSDLAGTADKKELTTDDTGSPFGGYVVDRELSAEIRNLITEYGVARREFTAVQLTKNSYAANNLVTDVTTYWVDEGSAIGSTQVVLGQESLELKKLGAIATLTSELLADQEIDLFTFIASRVAEGFARAEDEAFFIGDGTSNYGSFEGLLEIAGTNTVTIPDRTGAGGANGEDFEDVLSDDLLAMQDASPQIVARNGKYYMHRSIMNRIRNLKDDNGMPIFQQISDGGPNTIFGRPVVEVEVMPALTDTDAGTPFIIYGDLRRAAILGYKEAIAAKRFDAGIVRNVANNADINLITTDREAIRWTERVGYILIIPSAVTVLKTAGGS